MSKKNDILHIWQECFPGDSPKWRRMFFDAAYNDDEALVITDPESERVVSSLLLLPYAMSFHGRTVGAAYIYGAGTLRKFRARGFMSRLIGEALREAADRGDTFAVLIPATETLRSYYCRFGFSTVFFARRERFTAIHRFDHAPRYVNLSNADPSGLYPAFEQMMAGRDCCIQHSRAQFLTLMDDARMSGHVFAAVADVDEPDRPVAMAWAKPHELSDELLVTELLAGSDDAENAVLQLIQQQMPERPLNILRYPSNAEPGGSLLRCGMARVVNAEAALSAVAERFPRLNLTLRLVDPLLPENTGFYRLHGGAISVSDLTPGAVADLDVKPSTLTSLLFSSSAIGEVTGLPSRRPHMSLMLD